MIRIGFALFGLVAIAGTTLIGGMIGVAFLASAIGVMALFLIPFVLGLVLFLAFLWIEFADNWV